MPFPMRTFLPNATTAPRTELVLRQADGRSWRLLMSRGCEKFIGHYPRVPGIEADGPILAYRSVAAGTF
jgi:hypothetical protein